MAPYQEGHCTIRSITTTVLEPAVWDTVLEYLSQPALIRRGIQHKLLSDAQAADHDDDVQAALIKRLEQLKADEGKLVEYGLRGTFSDDVLDARMADIRKQREALTRELTSVRERAQERTEASASMAVLDNLAD